MQKKIDDLLVVLKSHVTEKRYASTVDLLWFLCCLMRDSSVEVSVDAISTFCQMAIEVLPRIDRQVQAEDIRLEFRNHLNLLATTIFELGQKKNINKDIVTRFKQLLDLSLEAKPLRPVIWNDPALLDWQSIDERAFEKFKSRRGLLRDALNQEVHLFKLSQVKRRSLYLKTIQCIGRMVLPWFSSLIYQRSLAATKKDVVSLLAPIAALLNDVLPFLYGDDDALGWESLHLYSYWVSKQERELLPKTPEGFYAFVQSALSSSSQSLVAISYCARLVTANGYCNNLHALSSLCDYVFQLEKGLLEKKIAVSRPILFRDYRKKLKKLRQCWQPFPTVSPRKKVLQKHSLSSTLFHESIVQKQQAFSEGSIDLMRTLLKENISILGEPPGKLALLLLGSSSRHDRLPYSDIECALIYEANPERSIQMRGYLYTLLSLLEFSIIRLGETHDFSQGGNAGFHLDESDHILSLEKQLIGTVDELYQRHVELTILESPSNLVSEGELFYATLSPCLVNQDWGGQDLFSAYQNKIQTLLNTPANEWTHEELRKAYLEKKQLLEKKQPLDKSPILSPRTIGESRTKSKKRLTEEKWQYDFEVTEKKSRPLTLRQIMALYCWVDVLLKADNALSKAKENDLSNPLLNIKDIYHKPLVYLALNLQLFLGTADKHATQMFESAYVASILPVGVKILLQEMLCSIIRIRKELHINRKAQEEETTLKALSLEDQITLDIIEGALLRPLKIAMEDLLKENHTLSACTHILWEAFSKVWAHYSTERFGWQERLPNHPLLVCLNDHPRHDGTKPSIDNWLVYKKDQQERLLLKEDDNTFQNENYRNQPIVWIERALDQKKIKHCLHPAAVQQLIHKDCLTAKGELQFSDRQIDQEKGRHLVMAVTIPASGPHSAFTVYLKVYPEMPALELAATELSLLLVGPYLPWVELVRLTTGKKSYPVLLSQGIQGPLLSEVLQSNQPVSLAPALYSQRVLLSLLLNQEDAKPSNFIAQPVKGLPEQIALVSIDNDRSLYPSVELNTAKQQWVPMVKDITFCFDAMRDPIDREVREAFLALEPSALLTCWLMLNQRKSYDLGVLFSDEEVISHFPKTGSGSVRVRRQLAGRYLGSINASEVPKDSILSLMLRKGVLEALYTKIKRLQLTLRENSQATHLDLLKSVEPYLARFYEKLLLLPEPPYRRFYRGFGALYDKTNTLETISENNSTELLTQTTTFRTFETQQGKPITTNELLKPAVRYLEDSLKELEETHKAQTQWRSILADLQLTLEKFEVAISLFRTLPGDLQALVINHLDFSQVLKSEAAEPVTEGQRKIIQVLIASPSTYQALCFRNCDVLTDKLLKPLLKNLPPLESLSLVNCPNLSEKIFSVIGRYAPYLQRLVLQDVSWEKISTITKKPARFFWTEPMGVKAPDAWYALRVLVIRSAKSLKQLQIVAPGLKKLRLGGRLELESSILDCPLLEHFTLDGILPKETLFQWLRNFPELKRLHIDNPLSIELCDLFSLSDLFSLKLQQLTHLAVNVIAERTRIAEVLRHMEQQLPLLKNLKLRKQGALEKTLEGHSNGVTCVTTLANGKVISGSYDQTLKVWDVKSEQCIQTLQGHSAAVNCVTTIATGEVVSGSEDCTLKVWDVKSEQCIQTLQGHSAAVRCVTTLATGEVVSGSSDKTLKVWDMKSRQCLQTLVGHFSTVWGVTTFASGEVVSGSFDKTLKVWDVKSGQCLQTLQGHHDRVWCVTTLATGEVVSGSSDKTLKVWNAKTGQCLQTLQGYESSFLCVMTLASGEVVSGSFHPMLKVWSFDSLRLSLRQWHKIESLKIIDKRIGLGSFQPAVLQNLVALCQFLKLDIMKFTDKMLDIQCQSVDDVMLLLTTLFDGQMNADRLQLSLGKTLLKNLTLKNFEALEEITGDFKDLKTLCLENVKNLSRENILNVIQKAPFLQALQLKNYPAISFNDISALPSDSLEHLSLDLASMDQKNPVQFLPLIGQTFPLLKNLVFHHSGIIKKTLQGHSDAVWCVTTLATGEVVSGAKDYTLRTWNNETGRCLQTFQGHRNWVNCVATLATGELVSGSWDKTLKVWSVKTGQCLKTLKRHSGTVWCVTTLAAGEVVSGSSDQTLKVWDIKTGKCLKTLKGHLGTVYCATILASGEVVSGSFDQTLKVWDVKTGQCLKTLYEHSDSVTCITTLPNGEVVSGSSDQTLKVWDIKTGKCLKTLQGHSDAVRCVTTLATGEVVSGSDDKTLRVWDVKTGQCLKTLDHSDAVACVTTLATGEAVSGLGDHTLKMWSFAALNLSLEPWQKMKIESLEIINKCVRLGIFEPIVLQNLVALCRFLNLDVIKQTNNILEIQCPSDESTTLLLTTLFNGRMKANRLQLSLGKMLLKNLTLKNYDILEEITGDFKDLKTLCLENVKNLSRENILNIIQKAPFLQALQLRNHPTLSFNNILALSLRLLESLSLDECSIDQKSFVQILTATRQTFPLLQSLVLHRSGGVKKTLQGHSDVIWCVTTLPTGEVVSGSDDNMLKVWNAKTGECLQTLKGHSNTVSCVTTLPNDEVISGSQDQTLKVWDIKREQCLRTLTGHRNAVTCVTVLTRGEVISGSQDQTLKVWDIKTGQCLRTLTGHRNAVTCITTLASGKVVSGSQDQTLKVWDIKREQCLRTLTGHRNAVTCITTLASGKVVSGSQDQTLKVWDIKGEQCLQTLKEHSHSVTCVTTLASGEVVSGSWDKTLKVWDAKTGQCLKTLENYSDVVTCVTALPAGEVVSGSGDNTLKVSLFAVSHLSLGSSWQKMKIESLEIMDRCIRLDGFEPAVLQNLVALCRFLNLDVIKQTNNILEIQCPSDQSTTLLLTTLFSGRMNADRLQLSLGKTLLKNLTLKNCDILEEITGDFKDLKILCLENVKNLSRENILNVVQKAPFLQALQLKNYPAISFNDISALPSDSLEHLSLDLTSTDQESAEQALTIIRQTSPLLKNLVLHHSGIIKKTLQGHSGAVWCVTTLAAGEVISGSKDGTLRVWNATAGQCLKILQGHSGAVRCVTTLPTGEVVSGSHDNTLKIWNVETGYCLRTLRGHSDWIYCVTMLSTGEVISGSSDQTLKVWNAKTGQCLRILRGHSGTVNCVTMLATGEVVSGSSDQTLKVWNVQIGQCLKTFGGHIHWVYCMGTLPSGELVSGSVDTTLKVWNAKGGERLQTLQGHSDAVRCVTTLATDRVVSGSDDKTLKMWNVKTGQCLKTLKVHRSYVYCITTLATGEVVSGSEDNMLKVSSFASLRFGFTDLNPEQPMAFKRLFFTPSERDRKHQARSHLFRFFSDRDRKSFGCVSQNCHAVEKEMDIVYKKSFR